MAKRLVRAKRKITSRRDPVPGAAGPPAPGPARRGARRRLPDLQRGLRRPRRPRRRGDPARARAGRADAGRARGARAAGADAASTTRGARRGSRTGRSSCCATRTARSGTSTRSSRARRRSTARWRSAAAVPTCVQAAIAALHTDDPQDWPQIAALYGELARLTGSPVVELNRAVAIAEAGDLEAALALVGPPRARPLPLPARDPRGAAAPARSRRGRPRGLRPRAGARSLRRRAAIPRAPPNGAQTPVTAFNLPSEIAASNSL